MKRILLIVGVALLSCFSVFAQKTKQTGWKPGMVALKDGQVVAGEVNYHFQHRLLSIKAADGLHYAFTPHQVQYFRFYDDMFNIDRVFAAAKIENRMGYAAEDFFEILLWGKIAVLGKLTFFDVDAYESKSIEVTTRSELSSKSFQPRWIEYDYFIFSNDRFMPLERFEKTVLPLMKDQHELIAQHVTDNDYDLRNLNHQLRVIEYFDKISPHAPLDLRAFVDHGVSF